MTTRQRKAKVADPFYSSRPWLALRMRALARDGWACVWCKASVRGKGRARIDHIQTRASHPELSLRLANVRTLCVACDAKRHVEKSHNPDTVHLGATVKGQPLDPRHWWNAKP